MKAGNQKTTRVWLHGASGRMGLEIQSALEGRRDSVSLMGGSGRKFIGDSLLTGRPVSPEKLAHAISHGVDVVIDFSIAEGNELLLQAMKALPAEKRPQVLIGTTGLSEKIRKEWTKIAAKIPKGCVFIAPNTSRGVLATIEGALRVQEILKDSRCDVAIIETHHRLKKDAPSGTAKMFSDRLSENQGPSDPTLTIASVRGGGVFGEHEIRFMGVHDEIIITHRAYSRSLFAEGALDLAIWQHKCGSKFKSKLISLSDFAGASRATRSEK